MIGRKNHKRLTDLPIEKPDEELQSTETRRRAVAASLKYKLRHVGRAFATMIRCSIEGLLDDAATRQQPSRGGEGGEGQRHEESPRQGCVDGGA